jgi:hypothetical protein
MSCQTPNLDVSMSFDESPLKNTANATPKQITDKRFVTTEFKI